MSPQTPYNNLLLFHNVGSGKTFTSIAVVESHKSCKGRALVLLKRLGDNQVISSFSNRIMIMDEIHNLKHSMSDLDAETVYGQMWRLSHLARNCKILLLSATPMIDKAEEILSILNLILDVDHQFDTSFFLTKDDFRRSIIGRISYLNSNQHMAKVIEEGVTLEGCSVKVVPSYMDGYQLEAYKKIDINNLDDSVYRNSIYYFLMTFWDGTYGAQEFTKIVRIKEDNKIKYTLNEEVVQKLRRDNLHLYSCKYSKMLDIIESNKDMLAFIFCEEVKGTGLIMMSFIFELFRYQLYDGENIDEIDKGLRYTLYIGDIVACSNPEKRLDGFRSPKNKYGEYVKILLGSRISGESVSLTNVRQVHIVTPHWNKSTIVQAIGRAVKSQSHDLLKVEERSIHVYRHVALVEEKSMHIEDVENFIRSCCVDYYLNVDTTTVRNGFGDDISIYLLWYYNDIEASILEIVTTSMDVLSIGTISALLNTKKSVVKALIRKGISLDNRTRIKEIKGMIYLDSVATSNKDTHLSSFKQQSFKACMKTRRLDGTWTTVSAEDELNIIQKIISKSKRSREIMETKHKIYAIFSNGDNRFRIHNSLSQNKERSLKDLRSINRGRCIDSHSGSMMMDILLYLLTYKTKQESIMDIIGPKFYNFSDQESLMSIKNLLLLLYNTKQKLYRWMITRTKKELADIMIKILIENDMYIVN
uniref:Helicase ATP-binding domain-containing protein n=1 Tax=Physcomitrium patens TaxID=3218 RepID=A0A7I4B397_PHYPA